MQKDTMIEKDKMADLLLPVHKKLERECWTLYIRKLGLEGQRPKLRLGSKCKAGRNWRGNLVDVLKITATRLDQGLKLRGV